MTTVRSKNQVTPRRYNLLAQALHWSMAAILIYLIVSSQYEDVPDAEMTKQIQLHSGLGAIILILGIARWLWRGARPRPATDINTPRWRVLATEGVHHAFYALFALTPVLGFVLAGLVAYPVRIFGQVDVSDWLDNSEAGASIVNSLHGFSADLMLVLIFAHVGAALYHQFIVRDGLIMRMLPLRQRE